MTAPPSATGELAVLDLLIGDNTFDRDIIRGAMSVWAGRQIEGDLPRPIDDRHVRDLNRRGLCAYCYRRLGAMPERRLEALACRACGDLWAALDGAPDHLPDPLIPFCRRLGREAGRLGIDLQKLARAIEGARRA
jgi:hypothetical protein